MGLVRVDQSCFNRGEIDPLVYARIDWPDYYKALKRARNTLIIPQGGARRRFGTKSAYPLQAGIGNQIDMAPLIYDNNDVYIIVFASGNETSPTNAVFIFLEGTLQQAIESPYEPEDIASLKFSQASNRMIITMQNRNPQQLIRGPEEPAEISDVVDGGFVTDWETTINIGGIVPIKFITDDALPETTPQVNIYNTYYAKIIGIGVGLGTVFEVYGSSKDAYLGINKYTLTTIGVDASIVPLNDWNISNIDIKVYPAYDFDDINYSAFTFTPDATSGDSVELECSENVFTEEMVGGLFQGNGGTLRLNVFTDETHMTGETVTDFVDTSGISGSVAFLGEPAWSDLRGWPRSSTFFQNRLWFGGSTSIVNGVWGSVTNDAFSFDDSETLDDLSIAWYPAAGSISYVESLTSTYSLLVHTNTGTFSTPLGSDFPVTPTNFTLNEQNKDGVSRISPLVIDNQIIYIDKSGSNVKNLTWQLAQPFYVLNNISITSSHLIVTPTDMAPFVEHEFTDGIYAFIVNSDGTMAIYQSLQEQNISAWSLASTKQNNTAAYFRHVTSGLDEAWFIIERQFPEEDTDVPIIGVGTDNTSLLLSGLWGHVLGEIVLCQFGTDAEFLVTTPQISTGTYYYARAISDSPALEIEIYTSYDNAANQTAKIVIGNPGNEAFITPYTYMPFLNLERLDFNFYTDCSYAFQNTDTLTGLASLEGEFVQIFADGNNIPRKQVVDGEIVLDQTYADIKVGLQQITEITPLPMNSILVDGNNLYTPTARRSLYISYYETIGGTVNGYPLAVPTINNQGESLDDFSDSGTPSQIILNEPQIPLSGIAQFTDMPGWTGPASPAFDVEDIEVIQDEPLPMTIRGFGYIVET